MFQAQSTTASEQTHQDCQLHQSQEWHRQLMIAAHPGNQVLGELAQLLLRK